MRIISLGIFLFSITALTAQTAEEKLVFLEKEVQEIELQKKELAKKIETTKLSIFHDYLLTKGLPALEVGEEVIHHAAMSLVYEEEHEQAKWVAHIISPDILNGQVSRSNDFREDPLVNTGTAIEQDYFLKLTNDKGDIEYDGFGYDRGHLAPSADFRWTQKGLSETYFYSNMSPQLADFNRGIWSDLENLLRAYVYSEQVPLYVVTGGLLKDDLPKIERSINQISIPKYYWKVAIDIVNNRGIAFLLPNAKASYPIEYFAVSIDEVETLTGIDFYASLEESLETELEAQKNTKDWIQEVALGDVAPLAFSSMPHKHYNTIIGVKQADKGTEIYICGTAVRTRKSRKGNVLINLDKAYPNEVFNVFINKKNLVNFAGNPLMDYTNQQICIYGEVSKLGKTPVIFVEDDKQFSLFKPKGENKAE